MAKDMFDELFYKRQKIVDELYEWAKNEDSRDALAMLDGTLVGIRNIIFNRQKDLIRRGREYGEGPR